MCVNFPKIGLKIGPNLDQNLPKFGQKNYQILTKNLSNFDEKFAKFRPKIFPEFSNPVLIRNSIPQINSIRHIYFS